MPIVPINDLEDPRLAIYRNVKRTNETRDLELFVLEGEKLTRRLLASRFVTASVLATDRALARVAAEVPPEVPLYVVPHEAVSDIVGYRFHLGILAAGRRQAWPGIDALLETTTPSTTLVVCPHVDNPENLGAVVRIADVFGAAAVLAGERCPDPLSRRVLRVSMGTSLRIPVLIHDDLIAVTDELRTKHGFELLASAVHEAGAEPLDQFQRSARTALLLGNESHGLSDFWMNQADRRLTIPMRPGAESLNVSVAAGILLYHLCQSANSRFEEMSP